MMKLLLGLAVVIASETYGQSCNDCNLLTGFACFSDNQYFQCNANGIDVSSLKSCATGICDFSVASTPCSTTSVPACPSPPVPTNAPTTTTTGATTTASYNANSFCASKAVGRYANPTDTTCTKYVYCYLNSGIKEADYTCAGSSLFDPSKGACEAGFVCTGTTSASTTSTSTTTTTTPTTATTIASTFNANTFCASRAVARYAYPTVKNCTKYVYCYLNGGIKGAVYICQGTTLFNPSLGACVSGYVCV